MMNWIQLKDANQISEIINQSYEKLQIIFKHSSTCGISSVALNRFQQTPEIPEAEYYFLDVRKHRDVSNAVASALEVRHESPQALAIKDGQCIYHDSHYSIDLDEITKILN